MASVISSSWVIAALEPIWFALVRVIAARPSHNANKLLKVHMPDRLCYCGAGSTAQPGSEPLQPAAPLQGSTVTAKLLCWYRQVPKPGEQVHSGNWLM